MRDIHSDLQDRANFIKAQISGAQNDFEKRIEQLKLEHQRRIKNPARELEAVKLVWHRCTHFSSASAAGTGNNNFSTSR